MADFRHIHNWVFDLDNTLYPAECNLFLQIDQRMSGFIEDRLALPKTQARLLQKQLYRTHGTTLCGLMKEHNIEPHDFMDYVHDIDLAPIEQNHRLRDAIQALPGQKFIFTNGSVKHAENVAGKIGVLDLFHGIFDVQATDYTPKPNRVAYEKFLAHFDLDRSPTAMFEDMAENLVVPHEFGLTTVLIQSHASWVDDEPDDKRPARPGESHDHVDHMTQNLTDFLAGVKTAA